MSNNNKKENKPNQHRSNRSGKGNRGKGNNGRQNQKGFKDFDDSVANADYNSSDVPPDKVGRTGVNDKAWWTRNGQILKDSATIPQMNPVGGPLNLLSGTYAEMAQGTTNYTNTDFAQYYVPGICTIECFHGPGLAYSKNDAVNQAFLSQMEYIRAQITPNIDYDYADQAMVELAVGEAYAWWTHMVRVYGVVRTYVFENQYFPRAMVEALGFDFDNIRQNLTDFRMLINQMALALGAFPVPELDYYKRIGAVYGNMFVDSNSSKAQIYALVPGVIRTYNPTAETGSQLDPKYDLRTYYRSSAKINMTKARTITWDIIDSIRNDDDVYKIFGNIKNPNTWGNRVYTIGQIDENYTLFPVPDRDFLHMIMNATCWYDVNLDSLAVTQDPSVGDGRILYRPRVQYRCAVNPNKADAEITEDLSTAVHAGPRILNVYDSDYIDPSDVIYWTRFTSCVARPDTSSVIKSFQVVADGVIEAPIGSGAIEICGRMHIYEYEYHRADVEKVTRDVTLTTFNVDTGEVFNNIDRAAVLASFNFHPTCWFAHRIPNPGSADLDVYNNINVVQQWETIATLDANQLDNLQWGAVYSLWGIDATSNYSG